MNFPKFFFEWDFTLRPMIIKISLHFSLIGLFFRATFAMLIFVVFLSNYLVCLVDVEANDNQSERTRYEGGQGRGRTRVDRGAIVDWRWRLGGFRRIRGFIRGRIRRRTPRRVRLLTTILGRLRVAWIRRLAIFTFIRGWLFLNSHITSFVRHIETIQWVLRIFRISFT